MTTLEDLIKKLSLESDSNFKLAIDPKNDPELDTSASNILFHLPLMTLIILISASNQSNNISVESSAHWVTRVLMEMYSNFVFSIQRLRLSSELRRRTVDAIIFLESLGHIEVKLSEEKNIKLTEKGKDFLKKYRYGEEEHSLLISRVQAAVKRVEIKGWGLL